MTSKALPNKISSWIGGIPIRSLLKLTKNPKGINYVDITESENNCLEVSYANNEKFFYESIPDMSSLGTERRGGSIKHLIWSETKKTIFPHILTRPFRASL